MKGLRVFFVNACEERTHDYIDSEWALSEMHALDVSIKRATGSGTHFCIEFGTKKAASQDEAFDIGAYIIARIMWILNYIKIKRKASYMYITSDFEVAGIEDPSRPDVVLVRCEFYVERDGEPVKKTTLNYETDNFKDSIRNGSEEHLPSD